MNRAFGLLYYYAGLHMHPALCGRLASMAGEGHQFLRLRICHSYKGRIRSPISLKFSVWLLLY